MRYRPCTRGSPPCSGGIPTGRRDVERAWADWAARTAPPLPAGLATAGREEQVGQVLAWLHGEPSAICVEGESSEEAFAFIAACLLGLPEQERTALLSRALVVRTAAAWDEVLARAGADSGLVLIPVFPHPVTVPRQPTPVTGWPCPSIVTRSPSAR